MVISGLLPRISFRFYYAINELVYCNSFVDVFSLYCSTSIGYRSCHHCWEVLLGKTIKTSSRWYPVDAGIGGRAGSHSGIWLTMGGSNAGASFSRNHDASSSGPSRFVSCYSSSSWCTATNSHSYGFARASRFSLLQVNYVAHLMLEILRLPALHVDIMNVRHFELVPTISW